MRVALFSPVWFPVPPDRYGIRGMRERAELVGATLDVRSRDRDGTRITIEITNAEARNP